MLSKSNFGLQKEVVPKQKIMLAKLEIMPKVYFPPFLELYLTLSRLMYTWLQMVPRYKKTRVKVIAVWSDENQEGCFKLFLSSF